MSSPEESTSINIIKNLKVLEELAGQDSIEDSQVANIYELLIETTEWTYETIMSEEIEIALQILDHLYFLDKVATASSKKFDFNRVFANARLTFAINYNIACCYQM